MKNLIKIGTIVTIKNEINQLGIVIENTKVPEVTPNPYGLARITGNLLDGVVLYMGNKHEKTIINSDNVLVINTNFIVNDGDILHFETIYANYVVEFNKLALDAQKQKAKFNENADNAFRQLIKKIKPLDIKHEYHFNSNYTYTGFKIEVGKKHDAARYFSIDNYKLTDAEIQHLYALCNFKIAGMEVAPTTIMIGGTIGQKQTLVDALNMYFSLNK